MKIVFRSSCLKDSRSISTEQTTEQTTLLWIIQRRNEHFKSALQRFNFIAFIFVSEVTAIFSLLNKISAQSSA